MAKAKTGEVRDTPGAQLASALVEQQKNGPQLRSKSLRFDLARGRAGTSETPCLTPGSFHPTRKWSF